MIARRATAFVMVLATIAPSTLIEAAENRELTTAPRSRSQFEAIRDALLDVLLAGINAAAEFAYEEGQKLAYLGQEDTRSKADEGDPCTQAVARVSTRKGSSSGVFATDSSRAWNIVIGAGHAFVDDDGIPVDEAEVAFPNGESYRASLVWLGETWFRGARRKRDLAVMMLHGSPKFITPLDVSFDISPLADGVSLISYQGDFMRGKYPSVSEGCRAAPEEFDPAIIRHDCTARPGSSGGPLLVPRNGSCQVVGINVAAYSSDSIRAWPLPSVAVSLGPYANVLSDIFRKAKFGATPQVMRLTLREQ
jgi:hypothetical protein